MPRECLKKFYENGVKGYLMIKLCMTSRSIIEYKFLKILNTQKIQIYDLEHMPNCRGITRLFQCINWLEGNGENSY